LDVRQFGRKCDKINARINGQLKCYKFLKIILKYQNIKKVTA